jgi:hypothetical protein
MQLNALHMRFAAIAAGLVIFVLVGLAGGRPDPAAGYVLIDFSSGPDIFRGLEVEIDGEVVGTLESVGGTHRNAFGVKRGTHEVRVLHPAIGCRTATVELEHPTQRLPLMLQIGDMGDGTEFFFDQ